MTGIAKKVFNSLKNQPRSIQRSVVVVITTAYAYEAAGQYNSCVNWVEYKINCIQLINFSLFKIKNL